MSGLGSHSMELQGMLESNYSWRGIFIGNPKLSFRTEHGSEGKVKEERKIPLILNSWQGDCVSVTGCLSQGNMTRAAEYLGITHGFYRKTKNGLQPLWRYAFVPLYY